MRITKLLLICICCAMLAPAAWGQTADVSAQPGILGYLDPHTGAFRPVPLGGGVEEPDALTTFGGTITVTFTITLKTAGLTSITCSANVSIADQVGTLSTRSYGETATVAATGSGTTRTCKVTIPYAWGLATQGSDSMSTFYTVSGHASAAPGLPIRSSSLFPLDTRKVPANGATTNLTAAVTL